MKNKRLKRFVHISSFTVHMSSTCFEFKRDAPVDHRTNQVDKVEK